MTKRFSKFMSKERKERWKELATITAGGLLEWGIEAAVDMSGFQFPDVTTAWNTGDAVGALSAAGLSLAGVYKKNKRLTQLGSGAVAVAMTNIVWKGISSYLYPLPGQISGLARVRANQMYGNNLVHVVGKYGRSTPFAAYYPRR